MKNELLVNLGSPSGVLVGVFCALLFFSWLIRYRGKRKIAPGDRIFFGFLFFSASLLAAETFVLNVATFFYERESEAVPGNEVALMVFNFFIMIFIFLNVYTRFEMSFIAGIYRVKVINKYDSKVVVTALYCFFFYFVFSLLYAFYVDKKPMANDLEKNLTIFRCFVAGEMLFLLWSLKSSFLVLTGRDDVSRKLSK